MTERIALYTGSFDPLTNGHIDVLRNAAAIFDRIVVAIGVHPGKTPMFSPEERARLIRASCKGILEAEHCLLEVVTFSGQECVALSTFIGNYRRRRWNLSFTAGGNTYPDAQNAAMYRCNSDERTQGHCQPRTAACADGR